MSALLWPAVGALTGLHAATWGAFKDSRFEGFRASSFVRSVCLGLLVSVPVGLLTGSDAREQVLVLIGLCYASERLVTEWWKTFLREDPQDGYAIPMRLAVGGRTVENRAARYGVGLAIAAGLALVCVTGPGLQEHLPGMPTGLLVVVGGIGGWLTAVGGAWKDAPIEGFQRWKFLRSPVVATAWAVVLLPFTRDLVLLAVAAGGARWRRSRPTRRSWPEAHPASSRPSRCATRAAAYDGHVAACTPGCTRCSPASSPSTSCRARHLCRDCRGPPERPLSSSS